MNKIISLITAIVTIARETFNSVSDTVRILGVAGITAIARVVEAAGTADAVVSSDIQARYGIPNGAYAWDTRAYEDAYITHIPPVLAELLGEHFYEEELIEATYKLLSEDSFAEKAGIPEELTPQVDDFSLFFEKLLNSPFFFEVTAANLETMASRFKRTPTGRKLSDSTIYELADDAARMVALKIGMFAIFMGIVGIDDTRIREVIRLLGYEVPDDIFAIVRS